MRRLAVAALLTACCAAPPAIADHSVLELVSGTPGGQPCPFGASDLCRPTFLNASLDGRHALIRTKQPLVASDSNDTDDLYEWIDGDVRRVGQGLTSGQLSADGSRIAVTTNFALVAEDTDGGSADVYEYTGDVVRLISAPVGGSSAPASASLLAIARDNSRIFFHTTESLDPLDVDTATDVYEREGNTLRLVSTGSVDITPPGSFSLSLAGISHDGEIAYLDTTQRLAPEDTDNFADIYERANGSTRLVTDSQTSEPGGLVRCCFVSPDGSRVVFTTSEPLLLEDSDGFCEEPDTEEFVPCSDVYMWSDGVLTLISQPGPCNGCLAFSRAMSEDGSRIYFSTPDPISPQDTAGGEDLYQWHDGTVTLISVGPLRAAGDITIYGSGSTFGMSYDGTHVYFNTRRNLTADDTDTGNNENDLYERFNGTTRLLTTTPASCCSQAGVAGVSDDGSSVFWTAFDALLPGDTNGERDIYEFGPDGLTLVSTGPYGQGTQQLFGSFGAHHVSEDGSRVFFVTSASMVPWDGDNQADIYLSRRATTTGYPRAQGATPFRVPLVPAAQQCLAPNRQHGPPFAFGSCNPPQAGSPNLTVGVGDGSPAFAKSEGRVRLDVLVGAPGGPDDSDVNIGFVLTNVMNLPSLSDYTGELRASANVRLTDRVAGVPSTTDLSFGFTVPCTTTADTTLGGDCRVFTSVDAVVPGAAAEGTRAIWGLDQWRVSDGGPDGDAETAGDNSLLAVQGVFVP